MDKKVKVTAEDISNVISIILKRVGGIPVKKYSVDLIPVPHVEEIKGIPNEDDYIVHGYEFTREEYEKIKDYVNISANVEYEWRNFDIKISINGDALWATWYVANDVAVLASADGSAKVVNRVMNTLEALDRLRTIKSWEEN